MKTAHVQLKCQDCRASFTGLPTSRFCRDCRYKPANRSGVRSAKWVSTPEIDAVIRERYDSRVKGRVDEIAAAVHWPAWAVRRRAVQLSLTLQKPQRSWSRQDLAFLEEHAGSRTCQWIATRLGRTLTAIHSKCKSLQLSRALEHDGYTLSGLAECFGADAHVVERWVREGRLRAAKQPTRPRDPWIFEESEVLRFIANHPTAFSLRHVDQTWFIDLVVHARGSKQEPLRSTASTKDERSIHAN